MMFKKLEVAEAILHGAKDSRKIKLEEVDFYYDSKKLLLEMASKGSLTTRQDYKEFIIDKLTISKANCEQFSLETSYNMEFILLLEDNADTMWAYKLKIPNVRLEFMETDLMKIKNYVESDDAYITYMKLKFSCLDVSIHVIE